MQEVVQSLWVGDRLTAMERLSIQSFLDNGHPYHLYTYNTVENVPQGAVICDANQIIPRSQYDYAKFSTLGAFSDFFRYKLLLDKGGWWSDTDSVCLRPFDFQTDHVFSSERNRAFQQHTNGGTIKAPVGSPIMARCWQECQKYKPEEIRWGVVGPKLLGRVVSELGMEQFVQPPSTFCPVDLWQAPRGGSNGNTMVDPTAKWDFSKSYAIHLWHELWRRGSKDTEGHFKQGCLYEQLKRKHSKVLIAILSCHNNTWKRLKQRDTYLNYRDGAESKFFLGNPPGKPEGDVVYLDCNDDYRSLIEKTRAMVRWAYDHDYDWVFKADDDTYIDIQKLLASDYTEHDYSGWAKGRTYCQGGAGYWLSRKAMKLLLDDTEPTPETVWEDLHVGTVLGRHGILPHHDDRYQVGPGLTPQPLKNNQYITLHKITPQHMVDVHRKWLGEP